MNGKCPPRNVRVQFSAPALTLSLHTSHPKTFPAQYDRLSKQHDASYRTKMTCVCRSGGGWCGWNKDATLLSVWWHGQYSQPYGKHRRRYAIVWARKYKDGLAADKVIAIRMRLRPMSDTQQSWATKLSNFVTQLYRATNLPRQLSIFHWQTIAQQTWLIVTQTTI